MSFRDRLQRRVRQGAHIITGAIDPTIEALREVKEHAETKAEETASRDAEAEGIRARQAALEATAKAEAERKKRISEAARRGRRGTFLTGRRGVEDELGLVNRPMARAATLLGETAEF